MVIYPLQPEVAYLCPLKTQLKLFVVWGLDSTTWWRSDNSEKKQH